MSAIAEKLKTKFQDRLTGELESCPVPDSDDDKVFWRPLTGREQKIIQKSAENSTAEGICMHVKIRALDDKGALIFGDTALAGMMNDFDYKSISTIFFSMTGIDLTADDIEKN
tara:strand:- start:351 stop:689 length:339 start_codon:yes stop_codon:yes gene_type:complete